MRVSFSQIGLGEKGIVDTLFSMKNIVKASSRDFVVINTARNIIQNIDSNRYLEASTIFDWLKEYCRFTKDPHKTELLQSPSFLLYEIRNKGLCQGDCDDITMLGASLMKSVGVPVGFRAISTNGDKLHHVYGISYLSGSWVGWDATDKVYKFGYEPSYARKRDVIVS